MKKYPLLAILLSSFLLASCGSQPTSGNNTSGGEGSGSGSQTGGGTGGDIGGGTGGETTPGGGTDTSLYDKYTVDFTTFDLGGNSMFSSQATGFKNTVYNFLKTATNDLVTDFDCTLTNRVKIEKSEFPDGYEQVQGFIVGASENDAFAEITFAKTVKKVSLTLQQYYNIFPGYAPDTHLYEHFDGQSWNDETNEYEGLTHIGLNSSDYEHSYTVKSTTYQYDDDGYPIIVIPEMDHLEVNIDSDRLCIDGYQSERCRIYSIDFYVEK